MIPDDDAEDYTDTPLWRTRWDEARNEPKGAAGVAERRQPHRRMWWEDTRTYEVPVTQFLGLLDGLQLEPWAVDGACAESGHPDAWFPEPGQHGTTTARAIAVCTTRCPVAAECLAYAMGHPNLRGIWGGTTEHQRRDVRRAARAKKKGTAT